MESTTLFIKNFFPLILIGCVFYFLIIRPQQKKMQEHKKMVENLKVGDTIILQSGFIGSVHRLITPEEAEIKLGEGEGKAIVRVLKQSIQGVYSPK